MILISSALFASMISFLSFRGVMSCFPSISTLSQIEKYFSMIFEASITCFIEIPVPFSIAVQSILIPPHLPWYTRRHPSASSFSLWCVSAPLVFIRQTEFFGRMTSSPSAAFFISASMASSSIGSVARVMASLAFIAFSVPLSRTAASMVA